VAKLEGSFQELARLIGCFPEEAARCVLELKRTETADVTLCNDSVTLKSRYIDRELKSKELTKLRVRKLRGNADVTPVKRDRVRVINKSKEKEEEIREEEEGETPLTLEPFRFPESPFENPGVILYQTVLGLNVSTAFAKAIQVKVKPELFGIWENLIQNKSAYGGRPMVERQRVSNWILDEFDKRVGEQNGTIKKPVTERDKQTERVLNAKAREQELYERGMAERSARLRLSSGDDADNPPDAGLSEPTALIG